LLNAHFIQHTFKGKNTIFITICILLINLFIFSTYFNLYTENIKIFGKEITVPHKQQTREAIFYANEKAKKYPTYEVYGTAYFKDYFDYYIKKEGLKLKMYDMVSFSNDTTKIENNLYKDGIILISLHIEPNEIFLESIKRNFKLIEQKDFEGTKIRIYKRIGN